MMPALVREGRLTGFAMRYLGRLVAYLAVFFITFSLGYTLLLRWVPVTLTPLKAIRLAEHLPEEGLRVRSNWVPLRKVAMPMVRAVIATEDNHFLSHRGKRLRGGSTISQQTAKNVFCLPARTWLRKGVEAWFTVLIETFWSKRRIMEVYLNVIETGRNMYGVEAPARDVYGKTAAELNAYEASMIATVLPNPLRRDMAAPSGYMVRRAAQVRSLMGKLGPIEFDRPEGGKDKN